MNAAPQTADSRSTESLTPQERLLTFRQVIALLGYHSNTSHTIRRLARRGQLKAVRLNERVIRYSESSVRALIAGGGA
jgi:predicted DNA-binding transcriptional regulator AlpA